MMTTIMLASTAACGIVVAEPTVKPQHKRHDAAGYDNFIPTMILGHLFQGRVASLRLRPGGFFFAAWEPAA